MRVLVWLVLLAGTAAAQDLAGCRAIMDSLRRLTCYDAIPLPLPAARGGVAGPGASAGPSYAAPPAPAAPVRPIVPASPPPPWPAVMPPSACTRDNPCVGPRGGVYYISPSGNRVYLPRR